MTDRLASNRVHVYSLPSVWDFTTTIQLLLEPGHFRRCRTRKGLTYEYASYLLHAHAGYVQAREVDEPALQNLREVLAKRGDFLAG